MQYQNKGGTFLNKLLKKDSSLKIWIVILIGCIFLIGSMAFSLTKGATNLSLSTIWESIFNFNSKDAEHLITIDIRIPRVIASALVGSALSVAGAVMQGTTRNPLADSGLLGINAGAAFALALCFALFPGTSYGNVLIFSFFGAGFGILLVNGIAFLCKGGLSPLRLILAGAAINALLTALSQGVSLYFGVAQDVMFWTVGGVAGVTFKEVLIMAPWVGLGLIGAVFLAPTISILSLGEETAKGLGLNTNIIYIISSIVVLILVGASVSVVGAVGFVGLIVPHITRFIVGIDYRKVIPISAVFGALIVVLADLGAKMINPPFETPIGAIISLIGVPLFLILARKQRRSM